MSMSIGWSPKTQLKRESSWELSRSKMSNKRSIQVEPSKLTLSSLERYIFHISYILIPLSHLKYIGLRLDLRQRGIGLGRTRGYVEKIKRKTVKKGNGAEFRKSDLIWSSLTIFGSFIKIDIIFSCLIMFVNVNIRIFKERISVY